MEEIKVDHGWGRLPRLLAKYQAKLKLNQYESQVLRGIGYFVTGYSKRDDTISLTQLADITGIDRRHISDIVNRLVKKAAIEVKEDKYRLLFYDEIGGTPVGAPFEIGGTWTGKEYTHTGDNDHLYRTKGHPQGCPPKTLSKDFLRSSPKKKEIFPKFTEEDLERNRKHANEIAKELMKKYGESQE